MTVEQAMLFALVVAILGMLLWGRIRHDFVAAIGLGTAVVFGLVPQEDAFTGFSSDAVLIVALVLIASRAFENSGALGLLSRAIARERRATPLHVAVMGSIGGALSAVINNVAALAMLMPVDMQEARKAGRPPGITLMPLAFATILGGMVTLIGTPPNIVASAVRAERLGQPYQMFDFTPVGLAVAVAGILFVALIGWRLVPRRADTTGELVRASSFKAELVVPKDAPIVGNFGAELDEKLENADVLLFGIIRDGAYHYGRARLMTIQAGDQLIVEGATDAIAAFIKSASLQEAEHDDEDADAKVPRLGARAATADDADAKADKETDKDKEREKPNIPEIVEAVVRSDSRLIGRSARRIDLRARFGVTLLGIARAGVVTREQVRDRAIESGDVLLLTGRGAALPSTLDLLGVFEITRLSVAPFRPRDVALAIGLFVGAIAVASTGFLSFAVAIAIAVAGYALFGIVPAREFYDQVEWPVVVMLACLLPIGTAFNALGGTALIAEGIVQLSAGYSAVVALATVMIVTMTLSDALNNVATMVIAGPIAIDLAIRLGVNPDTFLMGVAVAASCAFLTPIGHKNNTLIMGPGGLRFGDYWRMGLPLELVVLAVGIPMLLIVWPL
jgi:di/tricarboxylate transporter